MKIRIKGNSVRFRLTRSEVKEFSDTGTFIERTEFNGNVFTYALQSKEGIDYLEADFTNDRITMYLPSEEKQVWQNSERVGYESMMLLESENELHLLLEKDFVCMDPSLGDQSDNYPNPLLEK